MLYDVLKYGIGALTVVDVAFITVLLTFWSKKD
jgi:hypothetical protein